MTETSKALWSKPWGFLLKYVSKPKVSAELERPSDVVDKIQARLQPFWTEYGFRGRGRNYNRKTPDGLTQFINFQISSWGLSDDGYGRFTINAGIFIPEVWKATVGKKVPTHISLIHSTKNERIGLLASAPKDRKDLWWAAKDDPKIISDIEGRLRNHVLPFLAKLETRELCLNNKTTFDHGHYITRAVLIHLAGRHDEARVLLQERVADAERRKMADYANHIRQIINRLGL